MKKRPTEQFAALVEFDVLASACEIDCLTLAHECQRLCTGGYSRSRPVGDPNDRPGKFNRICRLCLLDRNRENVDGIVLKSRERKHRTLGSANCLDEGLVFRPIQRTDRLDMFNALGDFLADILDERTAAVDSSGGRAASSVGYSRTLPHGRR